jgi:Tfp pilus assembly protein PilF
MVYGVRSAIFRNSGILPMNQKQALSERPEKRTVPLHKRLLIWYGSLRLLNKLALWALLASVPVGLIAIKVVRPYYKAWKQQNALALADSYIAKGDARGATLAFRQAIRIDFKNPEVWKRLVKFLDDQKSPEAVFVWDRLVLIEPEVTEHRYRLAESALANGDSERAGTALKEMNEQERGTARYLLLSAEVSSASGKLADAEKQLEAAAAMAPGDPKVAYHLQKLRLGMRGEKHGLAERALRETAAQDGPQATDALRELTRSAALARDFQSASLYATRLKDRPDATAQDRVLFLDMEFASNSFALSASIAAAQKYALEHPEELNQLANYLIQRKMGDQFLAWLETQSSDARGKPEVKQAMLDLSIASGDWNKSRDLLREGPAMPPEVLNKVEKARDAWTASDPDALQLWSEALLAAKGNMGAFGVMERLASVWNWDEAHEKTLWAISEDLPTNAFVWKALLARELPRKETPKIASILTGLKTAEPANRAAINEWLRLQFLLNRGDPRTLLETAESSYKALPDNPEIQVTYILFLAVNGRNDEAVALAEKLGDKARREPRKAVYMAYALAKAGKGEEAVAILTGAGSDREEMLPEEIVLMDRATAIAAGGVDDNNLKPVKSNDEEVLAELRKVRESEQGDSQSVDLYETLKKQQQKEQAEAKSGEQLEKLRQEIKADAPPAVSPTP